MSRSLTLAIPVQFSDLDPMNVVYHGNYPRYFEQARTALLNALGYGYVEMKASGYAWPIVDMRVRYVASITFPQTILVTATLVEWLNCLKIDCRIEDQHTGALLTRASTTQAAVRLDTGELCLASPACLIATIEALS